jgi:hypothetical protein
VNERIEKLAELCGFRPSPSIYDRNQSFDIEKFAELIVRECSELVEDHYDDGDDNSLAGHKIRKHFGVK